jgi:hypothetical protein
MIKFNIYLKGKIIDSVFYTDPKMTREEVKRALVEHDGYDSAIVVTRARSLNTPKRSACYGA